MGDSIYERSDIQPIILDQINGMPLPKSTYDFYLKETSAKDESFLKNNDPYIIKQRLGLEYVLETDGARQYHTDAAVFIHLYYTDLMEECFGYIKEACRACDVYISTSIEKIARYIESECDKNGIKNCEVAVIDNRGQDIAALLLHHAKTMKKYQYVCFVHDKKSGSYFAQEEGYLWFKVLWDNTLFSSGYITNIIKEFIKDERLGMLSVPEPFWGKALSIVENGWGMENEFDDTDTLAQRLGLVCRPKREYPPIAIGTAFWARVEAVLPVLDASFTVEEFPEEGVGALSYAVERIFPYVIQSCGYYTGIAETKKFCVFKMIYLQNMVMRMSGLLRRRFDIYSEQALEECQLPYEKLNTFLSGFAHVYICGTGKCANRLIQLYPLLVHMIDGFIEMIPEHPEALFYGKKILPAKSVIQEGTGFILAIAEDKVNEVVGYLVRNGAMTSQILDFSSMSIFDRLG